MLTATAYDTHVEQLLGRVQQLHLLLTAAGVPYRLVGGMAVYLQVSQREPIRARLTADVDAAIDPGALPVVMEAARRIGLEHRYCEGVDMLVEPGNPKDRSAARLRFLEGGTSTPDATPEGFLLAPVADLVRMKLTSFRLKDRVHIQDLDAVGLITPEIEAQLPRPLQARLADVRASE